MQDHNFELSVNTGFLVNRYTDPEQWVKLVSDYIHIDNCLYTHNTLPTILLV